MKAFMRSRALGRCKSTALLGVSALSVGALGIGALAQQVPATGTATSTAVQGAGENSYTLGLGPEYTVESAAPGVSLAFPLVYSTDMVRDGKSTKKVMVSFSRGEDIATVETVTDARVSSDGGATFHEYAENSPGANIGRLPDGTLVAMVFTPDWENERHESVLLHYATSSDLGATWHKADGRFMPPAGTKFGGGFNRGLRVNSGAMVLTDGTLVVPAYTKYEGDSFHRAILIESRDRGLTWAQRGTMLAPTTLQGANELGLSRTKDGRLTAVLRTDGGSRQMLQVWSSDEGRTWTTPTHLQVEAGVDTEGVNPSLVLQPNGILLLTFGRPDNRILASYDGTGEKWQDYRVTFANAPEESGAARFHGSSAYTTVASLSASRSLIVGDTCSNTWGCKQNDELHRVWARRVDAVTPGIGKIDLATKVVAGNVKLSGDFAPANPSLPESRPQGAVDGSAAPGAAAMLAGANPQFTLELDRTYTLNRVGLMLTHGEASDADVQFSLDGKSWSAPVLRARKRVDWSLRYEEITPQTARFVRVVAPPGGSLKAVTEIELYSDLLTFENDPVFGPPRGFTDVQNAKVTEVRLGGHNSAHSLYLLDYSPTTMSQATRPAPPRATQTAEFDLAIADFQAPFVLSVAGKAADGASVTPWRFALARLQNPLRTVVRVYDGTAWNEIGHLKQPVTLAAWMPVRLEANASHATLKVGENTFTTNRPWQNATKMSGVSFATAGVTDYGGEFFIDDLQVSGK